jgi:hypothetical protein
LDSLASRISSAARRHLQRQTTTSRIGLRRLPRTHRYRTLFGRVYSHQPSLVLGNVECPSCKHSLPDCRSGIVLENCATAGNYTLIRVTPHGHEAHAAQPVGGIADFPRPLVETGLLAQATSPSNVARRISSALLIYNAQEYGALVCRVRISAIYCPVLKLVPNRHFAPPLCTRIPIPGS